MSGSSQSLLLRPLGTAMVQDGHGTMSSQSEFFPGISSSWSVVREAGGVTFPNT